jgi:glycosyltransferase involved in cell wall biosynthesis
MNISHFWDFLVDNQIYILTGVFSFSLLIQVVFYLGIYARLFFCPKNRISGNSEPVSVIICARNEAENLERFLPAVLNQQYADYEVIVVNDGSSDDTESIIRLFQAQYPHLRTTTIREDKKFSHGKKLAVTIGIKAARHDILVFTDADCEPSSNQWLKQMAAGFTDGKNIVLGYGGYFSQKGLLNKYIRYDTLVIATQYLSFAISGIPYMGVGRNLAYRKSFFQKTQGFTSHLHLLSGDDDLFVNEYATRQNVSVEFSPEGHTRSEPSNTFKKWVYQKRRHFTTAPLYKSGHKALLFLEPASRLLFYILLGVLLLFPALQIWVLSAFVFRLIVQLTIIKNSMIRFKENNLLLYSIMFDVFALFINFGLFISNRISVRNRTWM